MLGTSLGCEIPIFKISLAIFQRPGLKICFISDIAGICFPMSQVQAIFLLPMFPPPSPGPRDAPVKWCILITFFKPQTVRQSLILAFISSPYSLWSHHFELWCVKSYCLGYKSIDRIFIILRRLANFCVAGHEESLDKIHMYKQNWGKNLSFKVRKSLLPCLLKLTSSNLWISEFLASVFLARGTVPDTDPPCI